MHDEFKNISETNYKRLQETIKGKTAILVGPATTLTDKRLGHVIDDYDFVLRTNDGLEVSKKFPEDYGARCDLLFLNNNWCRRKLKQFQCPDSLQFILLKTMSAKMGYGRKDLWAKITMSRTISRKIKLRQLWKVGTSLREPLQSSHVAFNILGNSVKQLTITGVDFYEGSKSWNSEYNKGLDQHQQKYMRDSRHSLQGEKRYIKALINKKALQADSKVMQILDLEHPDTKFKIPKASK
jgi:hypothetical protein